MNEEMEISIILFSTEGREINIQDLKSGHSYLESKEMTPDFLWGCIGGIEVIVDGYKIIFRSFEFYVSLDAIDFLLNSLLWNYGAMDEGYIDDKYPNCVVSRFPSSNFIKLCKKDENFHSLSYKQTEGSTFDSKRFFNDETISKEEWEGAVFNALHEYFGLMSNIINEYPNDSQSGILKDYLNRWGQIKKAANKC